MTRTASVDVTLRRRARFGPPFKGAASWLPIWRRTSNASAFRSWTTGTSLTQIELPTSALRLLVDILAELAAGKRCALWATREVSDLLIVSRPFISLARKTRTRHTTTALPAASSARMSTSSRSAEVATQYW